MKTLLNNTSPWVYAPENTIRNHTTNQSSFINLEQTDQYHTETGDSPNSNKIQPPDLSMHREYVEKSTVRKIGPNDKYNSHHATNTASQKYEDYLREYNIHRNKCTDIIRTAFQNIRDVLKERESQRKNNITSHNSQNNANTKNDQTSESPQQVTGKNHITHKWLTPDTNPPRAHTPNTRQGTMEATIGLDRQDTSWNMTTHSYHAYIYTQNTLNSKNRLKPDHNSVGSKYPTQQTQTKNTSTGGENRLRQSHNKSRKI
jgi:hypothetical protein